MYDYGYYNNSYDSGITQAGNILGSVLIILVIISIISIVLVVLQFIGQWKCFKKAGYKGWECLIAGHNQFVNCTFAGVDPILVLFVMFGSLASIIPVIGWLAYFGFLIYYQVVVGINTAKAFGKGTGFGIALAIPLSAPIAWFILGNDKVVYVGPQKNNNVAQQNVQMNNQPMPEQQVNTVPQTTTVVTPITPVPSQPETNNVSQPFCTNCGNALMPNSKFCTNCGTQNNS